MSISANVSFRECCGNCKERPTWLASRATARQPPQVVAYALSFVSQTRRLARRLRRRGEAMPAHDVGHLDSVGRSEGGGVDHRGGLTKELGTDRGRRDGTQDPRVLAAMVVESVNRAARTAEGLPWPDVDPGAVDGPRQYALDAVDRFLVVIVAVRRCRESLRARNGEADAATAFTFRALTSLTISLSRSSRLANNPRCAPRDAISSAIPFPIPEEAPVIITTLLDQ